jgi:hypothetical protein
VVAGRHEQAQPRTYKSRNWPPYTDALERRNPHETMRAWMPDEDDRKRLHFADEEAKA